MKSLKQKTISGIKWQVVNNVLQKVISVGTFAVLARLLEPAAFGLFALAFVAIDGITLFKTAGIDDAVIQKKDLKDESTHTAFWMISGLGVVIFAICFISAPIASAFFKNQDVRSVIQVLGTVILLGAFARIPTALLIKQMRFKLISIIELLGSVINSVIAICFAIVSPNVWCLVWAYIIKTTVMIILRWYFSGYKPAWIFNTKTAKEFFGFGKFILGLNVLSYFDMNLSNVVVGRVMGVTSLGFFALATNIGNFINTHFTQLISEVMFPAYSNLQGDDESLKRAFLKKTKYVTMVSLPFCVGLIMLAEEFVLTIYGEKWLTIVPLIQLFGILQLAMPIAVCSKPFFTAAGKPHYAFNFNISNLAIRLPLLIALTTQWGLKGAVWSQVIATMLFLPINVYMIKKLIGIKISEFFRCVASPALCAGIMYVVISLVNSPIHNLITGQDFLQHFIKFGMMGSAGVVAFVLSFLLFDKASSLEMTQMMFGERKPI